MMGCTYSDIGHDGTLRRGVFYWKRESCEVVLVCHKVIKACNISKQLPWQNRY